MYGYGGNDELEGAFLHPNYIYGGNGDDIIRGGASGNFLFGDSGNDEINAWQGDYSELYGGDGNDSLVGGDSGNILDGGPGDDVMQGGDGADTYHVDSEHDVIIEKYIPYYDNDPNPRDTVIASIDYTLSHLLEDLTLAEGVATRGTGNSGDNTIIGNSNNNILHGGLDNDTLHGEKGDDHLIGGAGNDVLDGGVGNDLLDGGAGIDTASYRSAASAVTVNLALTTAQDTKGDGTDTLRSIENLTGSQHADRLTGNSSNNVLNGEGGNDVLVGGAGNDRLLGGTGDDLLNGGTGNDFLDGGTGIDTASYRSAASAVTVNLSLTAAQNTNGDGMDTLRSIENLAGSKYGDHLTGNSSNNVLNGEAGNDVLVGGAGNDQLLGGTGNDLLNGGTGNDFLDGGTGLDTASYRSAASAVTVNLSLTAAQDTKGDGWDTLRSIENLTGSRYADRLTGNAGNNVLSGEAGNDVLAGGAGHDQLLGGAGNDVLNGGTGNDLLDGGTGVDTAYYLGAASAVTVNLALTSAQDTKGAGVDTLRNVENITGTAHSDRLYGNAGNNVLRGENGNDILSGAGGNDTLLGGNGNDLLNGGTGSDVLTGGSGKDIFIFNSKLGSSNVDKITDFVAAEDTIRLENAIFSKLTKLGLLHSSYFVANETGTARDGNDYIVHNTRTGALSYDADGSGSGAAVQFATLINGATISSNNFVVI